MIDESPHGVGFDLGGSLKLSDLLKEAAMTVKRLQDSLEMALNTEMPTDARGSSLTNERPLPSPPPMQERRMAVDTDPGTCFVCEDCHHYLWGPADG